MFETLTRIQQRIDSMTEWINTNSPEVFEQQKHCIEGSQERVYWHYGYRSALIDIHRLLLNKTTKEG